MREIKSSRRLSDLVYNEIKRSIINCDIKMGERLKLKNLSESLNVSKTPIRDTLNKLEKEGFIINIPNRGAEVVKFDYKDITDICDIRLIIEKESFKLMCDKNNNYIKLAEDLEEFLVHMEKSYCEDDYVKYKEWDMKFHRYFSIKSDNKYLQHIQQTIEVKYLLIVANYIVQLPKNRKIGIDEHRNIINELKNLNPKKAKDALIKHLLRVQRDVLNNLNI